jgi:hypothetical protein
VLFLCFIWSGFLRTGLGVGATVLMLPFALFVVNSPLIVVPIVATQSVILSSVTVFQHSQNVSWKHVGIFLGITAIPFVIGLYGLILLPEKWLMLLVYGITLMYALSYIFQIRLATNNTGLDLLALIMGGYINGLSFSGGPPIAAVMSKYVPKRQFRDTFLAMVILIAAIKLSTFYWVGVDLQLQLQLFMIPAVLIGHIIGLRFHHYFMTIDERSFYRWLGVVIFIATLVGIRTVVTK